MAMANCVGDNASVLLNGCGDGGAGCPADCNDDGTVSSTDVSESIRAWLSDLASGTVVADRDGNAVVNSTDVSAFINSWFEDVAAGCG